MEAEGVWCVANNPLDRVVLLARVTKAGTVQTINGTPAWIRTEACPIGLRLPDDTVAVNAVVAIRRTPGPP